MYTCTSHVVSNRERHLGSKRMILHSQWLPAAMLGAWIGSHGSGGLIEFSYIWASNFKPGVLMQRQRKYSLSSDCQNWGSFFPHWGQNLGKQHWFPFICFVNHPCHSLSVLSLFVAVNGEFSHDTIVKGYERAKVKSKHPYILHSYRGPLPTDFSRSILCVYKW